MNILMSVSFVEGSIVHIWIMVILLFYFTTYLLYLLLYKYRIILCVVCGSFVYTECRVWTNCGILSQCNSRLTGPIMSFHWFPHFYYLNLLFVSWADFPMKVPANSHCKIIMIFKVRRDHLWPIACLWCLPIVTALAPDRLRLVTWLPSDV